VLGYRGFDTSRVEADYREFIETAEDHVILEIIVSTFQEFLESEIGASMHEERVIELRSLKEYQSHLAVNVRYLMNYILALCRAPGDVEMADVPIKLWVKYLPDTIEQILTSLVLPSGASFDATTEPSPIAQPHDVLRGR
jgi:hypothetical protein